MDKEESQSQSQQQQQQQQQPEQRTFIDGFMCPKCRGLSLQNTTCRECKVPRVPHKIDARGERILKLNDETNDLIAESGFVLGDFFNAVAKLRSMCEEQGEEEEEQEEKK